MPCTLSLHVTHQQPAELRLYSLIQDGTHQGAPIVGAPPPKEGAQNDATPEGPQWRAGICRLPVLAVPAWGGL